MIDFKRKVEQAIGAFKYEDDEWRNVFDRVGAEGGIDNKKIVNVLICILDELDAKKEKGKTLRETERNVSTGTSEDTN